MSLGEGSRRAVLAVDVGGTRIKSGLVAGGRVLADARRSRPALADRPAIEILDNLAAVLEEQLELAEGAGLAAGAAGLGFPGPSDYAAGIPRLTGLAKFESIWGLELEVELRRRLPALDGLPLRFENDAALFALGEVASFPGLRERRVIFLTLGTGCGSAFIDAGRIVRGRDGVPASGFIFDQPFRDGIIDEYISRRGILAMAAERGLRGEVAELAALAAGGEAAARELFREFGRRIAEALAPFDRAFAADRWVIGGAIARSLSLFAGELGPKALPSPALEDSALLGAALLFGEDS